MKLKLFSCLIALGVLTGCSSNSGFGDLDRFMKQADEKPRGKIEPLPEVQVYRAFTYSAAGNRSPFLPPAEVVVTDIEVAEDQSTVKPNFDRPPEVLESFPMAQISMVGNLQKGPDQTLWALISDGEGGVHMAQKGQYMGKNHGRIVDIVDGRIDIIEIVPNGHGGWLERPRSISLDDE